MDYSWRLYALLYDKYSWMCKKESKKITTGSSVDKIVKEKTEKKETQNTKRKETKKRQEENSQESKEQGGQQTPGSDVDYDLWDWPKQTILRSWRSCSTCRTAR